MTRLLTCMVCVVEMSERQQAKPKSKSKRTRTSANEVSVDEIPPLGPWAAYTIGHNCQFIRAWQVQCWDTAYSFQQINQVPSTLDEIKEGIRLISPRVAEDKRKSFAAARGAMRRVYRQFPDIEAEGMGQWQDFLLESSQGYWQWQRMVSRSAELFHKNDPLKNWFDLGSALGDFQVTMYLKGNLAAPGNDPSLRPAFNAAMELLDSGWLGVVEVDELATYKRYKSWMPIQKVLAIVVETADATVIHKIEFEEVNDLITKQAFQLDTQIRASLLDNKATRIDSGSKPQRKPKINTLYTELQVRILDALNGQVLSKSGLARPLDLGDGRALYRKGGITELVKEGVVIHQDGVGYFRPDAPPPERIPLGDRTPESGVH